MSVVPSSLGSSYEALFLITLFNEWRRRGSSLLQNIHLVRSWSRYNHPVGSLWVIKVKLELVLVMEGAAGVKSTPRTMKMVMVLMIGSEMVHLEWSWLWEEPVGKTIQGSELWRCTLLLRTVCMGCWSKAFSQLS